MQSRVANSPHEQAQNPNSTWAEIRTAYASGLGLRELARNMGIPAGTVLARSKREGWTQQIATAKLLQRPAMAREIARADAIEAITPTQSAAISVRDALAEDSRVSRLAMSRGLRRAAETVSALPGGEIIGSAQNVRAMAASLATIHGWASEQGTRNSMLIQLINGNADPEPLIIGNEPRD